MMNKILSTTAAIMLMFFANITPIHAQDKTFDDVLSMNLKNFGAIMQDEEVTGYFFFYESGKVSRKERKYIVELLDQNLEPIGRKSFTGSRYLELREGTYNGSVLALRLADSKEDEITIKLINAAGERVGGKTYEYSVYDDPLVEQSYGAMTGMGNKRLFSIPGRGFAYYSIIPQKGRMSQTDYNIKFISQTKGERGWTAKSRSNSENYEAAAFVAANEEILISTIMKRKGAMSRDLEYFIMATDVNTGDKLFEHSLEDRQFAMSITNAYMEGENIHFFGEYYAKEEKTTKAKSLGICTFTCNKAGEFSNRQYIGWNKDVSRFLPASERGKIKDIGYMFFHKFLPTSDGKIIGIAENYHKDVSAGGMAFKAIGGRGASAFKIVVEDFYIFTFSSDFKLEGVDVIEKNKTNESLPEGAGLYGVKTLGLLTRSYGGFDYRFAQKDEDGFSISYLNFEKRKGEKNGYIYGSINHYDNEISVEKINIDSEASQFYIRRAKAGYILIIEYYYKTKRLVTRLEKVN